MNKIQKATSKVNKTELIYKAYPQAEEIGANAYQAND